MSRNMSFMLTTEQAYSKTKDVTRRDGWWFLNPGDVVQQVEKGQGLKKGERIVKIHLIRIVSARPEPLDRMIIEPLYGKIEVIREGFPGMISDEFVEMFCLHNKCHPCQIINRIEFKYL